MPAQNSRNIYWRVPSQVLHEPSALHTSMENQIVYNRYIKLNELHKLLHSLFGTNYEVEVRSNTLSSAHIDFVHIQRLIYPLYQERQDHYNLAIPRKLTEASSAHPHRLHSTDDPNLSQDEIGSVSDNTL